jgi:hypothetical protein
LFADGSGSGRATYLGRYTLTFDRSRTNPVTMKQRGRSLRMRLTKIGFPAGDWFDGESSRQVIHGAYDLRFEISNLKSQSQVSNVKSQVSNFKSERTTA